MAGFAIGHGMRPGQGESARCVQIEIVLTILPVARRVTVLAVGTELTVMLIIVTVNARCPHSTEDRALMTSYALGRSMGADQGEAGLGVVKFDRIAHNHPR
jgi:hypothetical protein